MKSTTLSRPAASTLFARVLRHALPGPWPEDIAPSTIGQDARLEGVAALVLDCLRAGDPPPDWPAEAIDALEEVAFDDIVRARARDELLDHASAALDGAGIEHVALKGAAVARCVYRSPWHRPSVDLDILVLPESARQAEHALSLAGWQPDGQPASEVHAQRSWHFGGSGQGSAAPVVPLDLHFAVSTLPLFQRLLPATAMIADAQRSNGAPPVPSLPLLFVHACVHRLAHHNTPMVFDGEPHLGERLIWLEDLRRLGTRLDDGEWDRVATLTGRHGLGPVVEDALRAVTRFLGHGWPKEVLARFTEESPRLGARLLLSPHPVARLLTDFVGSDGPREWLKRLRAHGLPSERYMRETWAPGDSGPLLVLHARRLLSGLLRRLH